MVDTIKLKTPVLIDGEKVSELTYDVEKIGTDQFMEAETRAAAKAAARNTVSTKVIELDAGFHIYLGIMAVIAENPGYTVEDIERVTGPDIMKIMRVGRSFMTAGAEEGEDEAEAPEPEDEADEESYLPALA